MPNQPASNYRFKGKHAFITYPRTLFPAADLFAWLKSQDYNGHKLDKILVATEKHKDGTPHIHVYLRWVTQFTTRNERFFDFGNQHPNVQTARTPRAVLKYCTKAGNYKAEELIDKAWQEWEIEVKVTWKDVAKASNEAEFWESVKQADPRALIVNNSPIKRYAERTFQSSRPVYVPEFERHKFVEVEAMSNWFSSELRFVTFTRNSFWPMLICLF